MKKNMLFLLSMIVVLAVLFMLSVTGIAAHIGVSVAGVVLLVAFALKAKGEWKFPMLEILMRVFYAVALITGVVIMNAHGVVAVAVIHKISAALCSVTLIVNEILKMVKK